ncbi:MAG TPA: amidohydrolase family protein [Thermoanaerobaculia bacterium]|nr:amidohydrolase family protein [Thermoanaerobaculia bacterium]
MDASGLYLAPGFIDLLGQSEYNVLVDPRAASKITQGITTEVTGEGDAIAPNDEKMFREAEPTWKRYGVRADFFTLADYFARLAKAPPTINLGTFVGSGGLRQLVVGGENRRATPAEVARMAAEVEKAMQDGALGLSSSLQYVPDIYNSADEIVAMARAAAKHGGVYFVHQRSESNAIDASLDEVFRIAREAKIPANVWHLKTAYKRNWGRMPAVLARLEAARAEGLDVAANQYPWTAASNPLSSCLPPWMREGGNEKLLARLKDPALREKAKADMGRDADDWQNQYFGSGGPSRIIVSAVLTPALKALEGRTIEEIAAARKKDARDALMDVVLEDGGHSSCIFFCMDEEDVKTALKHRLVSFCTDSGASATDGIFSEEKSHPRGWASAARILGTYVRDEKVLPLEDAVRKMTSFAAARAGLKDRGLLREGFPADLVAFDLAKVRAVSTYADPLRYSEGFPYVAVNGVLVVDGSRITSERPGRALRGPGFAR